MIARAGSPKFLDEWVRDWGGTVPGLDSANRSPLQLLAVNFKSDVLKTKTVSGLVNTLYNNHDVFPKIVLSPPNLAIRYCGKYGTCTKSESTLGLLWVRNSYPVSVTCVDCYGWQWIGMRQVPGHGIRDNSSFSGIIFNYRLKRKITCLVNTDVICTITDY